MMLVTGASGFVGQHFLSYQKGLSPSGATEQLDVLPIYFSIPIENGIPCDLRSSQQVNALFQNHTIDGIIHLAAESRTGVCQQQPGSAYASNVIATENLLNAARGTHPWFLYMSTDMVFDGLRGSYLPEEPTNPINEYGKTKALAENLIQNYPGPHCILRPALIYGESIGGRGSSFSWTYNALKSGEGKFFSDEIRTPVWVEDLVRLISVIAAHRITGIVHAGGPDVTSRWEFAQAVAATYSLPISSDQKARLNDFSGSEWRPRDLSLVSDFAHTLCEFHSLDDALKQIATKADEQIPN